MAVPTTTSSSSSSPETTIDDSLTFDQSLFTEFISTHQIKNHQISLSTSPSTPLYTMTRQRSLNRHKPSLVLHAGAEKTGPITGLVKIHISQGGYFTIGIGTPDLAIEEGGDIEDRMVWERMQRTEKRRYRRYRFEYEKGGERRVFMWRRTNNRRLNRLKDMELRAGDDEGGELMAVWKSSEGLKVKKGSMFVKREGEGDGGEETEEQRKWTAMVLLTGFAIIEAYIRRGG